MLRRKTTLIATMLALLLPLAISPAMAKVVRHDGEQATLEGCLTQAASQNDGKTRLVDGVWVLTTTDDGTRIFLKGNDDLEKYDNDQKVRVEGTWKIDRNPELTENFSDYLEVNQVEELAAQCKAPIKSTEDMGGRK